MRLFEAQATPFNYFKYLPTLSEKVFGKRELNMIEIPWKNVEGSF